MFWKLTTFAVFVAAAGVAFHLLTMMDFNKRVYNHRPGPCRTVRGIEHGAEDIEVIREKNIAFITSGIYYMQPRSEDIKGQIFLYDFNQEGSEYVAKPLEITGKLDRSNFYPHGLSSFAEDGRLFLYAICHDRNFSHSVEVFEYIDASRSLNYLKSIRDTGFIRPNNLVMLDRDRFLFTNDGSGQSSVLSMLEMITFARTGSVAYYDGKASHTLVGSLRMPNGITIDPSRKFLLVATTVDEAIYVYQLSKDLKSATLINKVELHSSPDNLFLDEFNSLWIAAFPVFKDCLQYIANPDDSRFAAPSQVLRVAFSDGFDSWTITEPYVNDGSEVAGSSIAVAYRKQLLIGTVFRTLLRCEIVHPSVV